MLFALSFCSEFLSLLFSNIFFLFILDSSVISDLSCLIYPASVSASYFCITNNWTSHLPPQHPPHPLFSVTIKNLWQISLIHPRFMSDAELD